MVRQVTASEAKAKLLALLDELASGDEIEITKHRAHSGPSRPGRNAESVTGPHVRFSPYGLR